MIRAVELYTGSDGASHVKESSVPESSLIDVRTIRFEESPPHSSLDWHEAPQRQYVITLDGTLEFTTRDGETFVLRPGDVLLAADDIGSGHKWRLIDERPWRRLYAILDEKPSLTLRRSVAALPERVFEMWTRPELLRQWYCPVDYAIESVITDVREGGAYRIGMRQPNGEIWYIRGNYREVRRPERLVFTWLWEEDDPKAEIETQISVDFTPSPDGTDLLFRQSGFASTESRDGHEEGWNGALDRLAPALKANE
jgi:uncharacterized protein YndB with AHSA1/START domain/quercetin dioxygenase-like cupin family protein